MSNPYGTLHEEQSISNPNNKFGYPPISANQQFYPQGQPDLNQPQVQPQNFYGNQGGYPNQPQIHPGQGPSMMNYGVPIVVQQEVRTVPNLRSSENLFCNSCQRIISTQVSFQSGAGAWISAGIITLFGCWLGCCFIPFCVDDCQDAVHFCPNCRSELGRKKFLFGNQEGRKKYLINL